jgi:predicted ester cyclase
MTPKEVAMAFVDAHNRHDVDQMLSLLTEDSVMIDVAAPIPLNSKADVRKLYEMIFAAIDINWGITGMIAEGNKVFVALRTTGPGIGLWLGRDLKGARLDLFEGLFLETQGNQIKCTQAYSDTATLTRQCGGYSTAIEMEMRGKKPQ